MTTPRCPWRTTRAVLTCSLFLTLSWHGWCWAQGPAHPTPSPTPLLTHPQIQEFQMEVYVQGAVPHPGAFRLPVGSRVLDALILAGGTRADANLTDLNMVATLSDGATVVIASTRDKDAVSVVKESAPALPVGARPLQVKGDDSQHRGKQLPPGKININRATAEEIAQLPGIGPAMAQDIVAFRQQLGRFKDLRDLRHLRGFGEKRLKRIQDFVTL